MNPREIVGCFWVPGQPALGEFALRRVEGFAPLEPLSLSQLLSSVLGGGRDSAPFLEGAPHALTLLSAL
jgi:hypothetical protein